MADEENEIRQELLLDAQSTLDALARVDTAFNALGTRLSALSGVFDTFNSRAEATVSTLRQMAAEAQRTVSALKGVAAPASAAPPAKKTFAAAATDPRDLGAIQDAGQQAVIAGNAGKAAVEQADRTTRNWLLSWQTLARVIQTQIIVRSMNAVRDAFEEAYQSNIKFVSSISEIRAIDADRKFDQIAGSVRALSDAFNQPIEQVAEAQYQAISNQFVKTTDQTNILIAANQLGKVTVQDLGVAVSLLTGTLNAYGDSSEMAGARSAQFFEAVSLGHFRLNDLATAMGRTQTIGHELGVEMEELEAALITVTIGGVKANEAATQIRGIMSALLKPSQNLREAFHNLGVESGEDAIATWGLMGTLQQLEKAARGSASGMAALFPNVRGLAGALRIGGEGADKYAQALEHIYAAADQTKLKGSYAEFMATDAQRVTAELNKLKNYFTTEFGADVVKDIGAYVGSTEKWIAAIRPLAGDLVAIAPVALLAAGAMVFFSKSLGGMSAQAFAARTSLSELRAVMANPIKSALGAVALFEIARVAGSELGEFVYGQLDAEGKSVRDHLDKQIEARRQASEAAIALEDRKSKELLRGLRQYMAEANRLHIQHQEDVKASAKIEEQVTKLALDRIMEDRRKLTNELLSIAENARKAAAETIPQKEEDIHRQMEDRALAERAAGRSPQSQYQEYEIAERRKLVEAERLQASAMDTIGEKRADATWKQAEAYQRQLASIAGQLGDTDKLRQAEDALWDIDNRRLRALDKQVEGERKLAEEADARLHTAQEHDLVLEEQRRKIEETLKTTTKDEKGAERYKTTEEIASGLDKSRELIAKFKETYESFGTDFSEKFKAAPDAFQDLQRKAEEVAASFNMSAVVLSPDKIQGFFDSLRAESRKLELEIPVVARIAKIVGLDLASASLKEVLDEAHKQNVRGAEAERANRDLRANEEAARIAYQQGRKLAGVGGPNEPLYQELDRLMGQQKISDRDWSQARRDIGLLRGETNTGSDLLSALIPGGSRVSPTAFSGQQTMIDALAKMRVAQTAEHETPANHQELKDALIEAKGYAEDRPQMDAWKASLDAEKEATDRNTEAMEKFSLKVMEPGSHCFGGQPRMYDYGGGTGTDTIPAMLSPGEMVINAMSARKFSAQLMAMNAGIQPVFRSNGGSVTNIGDVNVTVNGGGTGHQTARTIATELRRELRRGISTL
jgi:TP901 family phage tail tape measure protein